MDDLATWLGEITWPLVTRVLSSLGLGTITFVGADTALQGALGSVGTAVNGLAGPVAAILAMTGFFDALAITSGGLVSGLSWLVMKQWAFKAGGVS